MVAHRGIGTTAWLALLLAAPWAPADAGDDALARANRVLSHTILVDGHNDLPIAIRGHASAPGDLDAYDLRGTVPGQTDIPRLRAGHVGAQFWSVYIPGELQNGQARMQLEQIDIARRLIAKYPDVFQLVGTAAEVRAAHRAGRIGSLLGMEGGYGLENSFAPLRAYYDLGVRYMTLTHNSHTDWADSAMPETPKFGGLSPFGEQVVREMNRLGMLVDLSHTSADTMRDTLDVSKAPVIFSHAAARGLVDISRNVPDDVIARLPANGGVLMVTFVVGFVSADAANVLFPAMKEFYTSSAQAASAGERRALYEEFKKNLVLPRVTVGDVADHIEYVVSLAGIDHVGIGGDFDGNDLWPEGLSDVSMYPNLFAELIRRGWSDRDLAKLAGGNVLRAMEQAERVARELQRVTPAANSISRAGT
ncbi:MAG TPA: dipeptidase [Steroidobacteraceae bacterium]|nr:dipeptidase [Steroidobacteraceae bacterium]HNS27406.1 dipeptidase [Steroidobacteraceae bacterium]